ncbi:DUF3299 domain-containing protein [Ponticaulis sp.]|uniref:DUF3299 domain-containing protein n=1 Tax=Ponticaulis sp. TaxID=2020902 RepID=UPI00260A4ED9|nr:DUF3299 domain-containing protein [Ponticaulis sp.]MDF1679382.1 DUF3299 domain-containing protein [Ponticaulis sp.]
MMKLFFSVSALLLLSACSDSPQNPSSEVSDTAPPVAPSETSQEESSPYWGVEPGEPLPIVWSDLLPEGALDEYFRQQEEFYERLEMRLQAEATRLSDLTAGAEIEEGSDLDYMPQFGTFDTVEDIDGTLIRIPGYVVPFTFETDDRYTEFLFVPSQGACIHTPPPPPNQVIYVRSEDAARVEDIWAPYYLEGVISIERNENDLGNAAYTVDLSSLELFPVPR